MAKLPKAVIDYFRKIGRHGASAGGKARAAKMTPEERTEVARKAAKARWAKARAKQEDPLDEEPEPAVRVKRYPAGDL